MLYSSGTTNHFVDLSFNLASETATCLFLHQQESSYKSCSIMYGLPAGETCTSLSYQSNTSESNYVYMHIGLPTTNQLQSQSEYCFTITASNGTLTAMVEGTFTTGIYSVS